MPQEKIKSFEQYLSLFDTATKEILIEINDCIATAAPKAKFVISYNMPAFKQKQVLVYFAAYKNHLGFYPTSSPIRVFEKEISKYQFSKGAIQFPLNKKIPRALISKIVKFRLKEVEEKLKSKGAK